MSQKDSIVARIMSIRNGMILDADAEALIRDALDARQTSPETATLWRKKPIVTEAWQWHFQREGEMRGVCNCHEGRWGSHLHTMHDGQIVALEVGDWIIPEPDGKHYYPCKPEVFANTYEPAGHAQTPALTRESVLAAVLKAGNCGIGDTGPDGKWRAIACNDEKLKGERHHYFKECDCSKITDAIVALADTSTLCKSENG